MRTLASALAALSLCLCLPASVLAEALPITGGAPLTESFDSLAATGSSSALPAGWAMSESGNNADSSYAADDGSAQSGNTYSYGASGSPERALGLLQSGSLNPTVGVQLQNATGGPLVDPEVGYTGELWRLGVADRGGVDRLDFQYSLDATSLTSGTWHDVDALDFTSPDVGGAIGPRDGNHPDFRTVISGTLPVTIAEGQTFWLRWSDLNVSSNDDGLAIDDFHIGTGVDLPPFLAGSAPVDGGAMPANARIDLVFSEPVSVTGEWVALDCSSTGALEVADLDVGGGPTAFSLRPLQELVEGESCTLSLAPALVVDQDGTPDPLEAPHGFAFSVTAPVANALPVVLSTTPMDGADAFPPFGDLVVLFSEPVTLAPGAFTLTCLASTGIVLEHAGSGTSFSIGTGTALVGDDACTFTIHASLVQDSEGAAPLADTVVHFVVAASSSVGYYDQVNTSSPGQLRCSLHETIRGHTILPYGWEPLEDAEEAPEGACPGSNYILDVYRNRCYQKVTARSNPVGPNNYNREHVWPRSLGFNGNSLAAHNDLHMLHLSASDYNGSRGNMPFANCTSGCTRLGTDANNGDGGGAGRGDANWYKGPDGNQGSFEVWDRWKGNMARAIFYMAIRYEGIASEDAHDGNIPDLELTDNRSLIQITSSTAATAYMGLLTDLLEWHAADPVDARELARNEVVFGYQNNRNPFVDHPEWATRALFESTQPASCVLGTPNATPVAVDDAYDGFEEALLVVAAAEGVLANDSDADDDPLSAELVAEAGHGTVQLAGDGSFEYQPDAGYCGTDQFTYRASDGQALSAVAIVAISLECAAEPEPAIFANGFED